MSFQVGDRVKWVGIAGGFSKEHVGEVVVVVPVGITPEESKLRQLGMVFRSKGFGVRGRKHESYLVKEGNFLRWPVVSRLSKIVDPSDTCAASVSPASSLS